MTGSSPPAFQPLNRVPPPATRTLWTQGLIRAADAQPGDVVKVPSAQGDTPRWHEIAATVSVAGGEIDLHLAETGSWVRYRWHSLIPVQIPAR